MNPPPLGTVRKAVTPITVTHVEAARALGVSVRTLHRWERQKLITGRRVGGLRLYPVAELRRLVGA